MVFDKAGPYLSVAAARARHPALRADVTLVGYEVRRLRGQSEMQAALKLRHDVFCVEQGVPEHEELDGRDHDGIHLVAIHGGEVRGAPAGRC